MAAKRRKKAAGNRVLVSPEAKALELGCSLPTLWRKVRAGILKPIKLYGRSWFETGELPTAKKRRRLPCALDQLNRIA